MESDANLNNRALTCLTHKARNVISLLNTTKVLPSEGSTKLPRYWRGLASLVGISAEAAASISESSDRTGKVLDFWCQKNDGTATLGRLFEYLQLLDRYDVYDDLIELALNKELIVEISQNILATGKKISISEDYSEDLITFDDLPGQPQYYHAYVLYAKEDKDFVDDLMSRMRAEGFKLCTEDDLLPGHSTQYAPVSRLISERCHRIILIYSPEFLSSPANSFYMDYAQAVGIENKKPKIIPCMYRSCQLPAPLAFYHNLYYSPPGHKAAYDFWSRLSHSLQVTNLPRINSTNSSQSSISVSNIKENGFSSSRQDNYLALPPPPTKATSMNGLDKFESQRISLDDSKSLSNVSQISISKKSNPLRKLFNTLRKKNKKAIALEN